jgi:hypothetical protein
MKPWLLLAVIFVAGGITGSALTMALGPRFMHRSPPGAQQMRKALLMQMTERLHLTADQQAKVQPILDETTNQLQSVRRDEADRIAQIFEQTNQKLATILSPDQQAEMGRMVRDMNQNRERMFPGRMRPWRPDGPGGPHGPRSEVGNDMMPPPPPPPSESTTNAAPVKP